MAVLNISELPAPKIIEELDFEQLYEKRKQAFIALYADEKQAELIKTLQLESEPIVKLLQESAYNELILRQRINEAAMAVMIAHSNGEDLDNLTALFNVKRLTIQEADDTVSPPLDAIYESDLELRNRAPEAFEGLSVAGPKGAYIFYAKSADGKVLDAEVISPAPAYVDVVILSRENNGIADNDLLTLVDTELNAENRRPIADRVTVKSAEIIEYEIKATLFLEPYPEYEPIKAQALASVEEFTQNNHRIGVRINRSAIIAALHVVGVLRVELDAPFEDLLITKEQASLCTSIELEIKTDE